MKHTTGPCLIPQDVGELQQRLVDFITGQGILLELKESIAPALGVSYGGRIALLPGQSPADGRPESMHPSEGGRIRNQAANRIRTLHDCRTVARHCLSDDGHITATEECEQKQGGPVH
jgi:hypothetical protein